MCDYSLEHIASRPAVVGDELHLNRAQGGSSKGMFSVKEEIPTTAVCLIPGTELGFEKPIEIAQNNYYWDGGETTTTEWTVAKFVEMNHDNENRFQYHDALEFPDGSQVLLQRIPVGQKCKVLQMPAEPVISHIDLPAASEEKPVGCEAPALPEVATVY